MAESLKNELIKRVNNFGGDKNYWDAQKKNSEDWRNKSKLGSSNIRSVSNICNNADCYSEIRLYIEYKIAKGNGWDERAVDKKTFGQVVLDDMDFIYEKVDKDDAKAIKWISLYFGYLYWKKATIEKERNKEGYYVFIR